MKIATLFSALSLIVLASPVTASAESYSFSTGNVTNSMAMASRPESSGKVEIEAADDFLLNTETLLTGGTFTGLLVGGTISNITQVRVEIYRVFPNDSDVSRTTGAPTFSTAEVPTRVNSPSDVAFKEADISGVGGLSFSASQLVGTFTALNSVKNGINPKPNQTTGGELSITGQEVQFTFTLTSPLDLPQDHYFFVPQVGLSSGDFYWLSGTRPIVAPGTPFNPDLQAWIGDGDLDPDWLRVGTDIVGGTTPPTFNGAFTLTGQVPEPSPLCLTLIGLGGVALFKKKFRTS